MTRPIRRGYPWPPHGRAVIRPAAQVVHSRKWREITGDLEDFMRHMSGFFAAMPGRARQE